MFQTRASGTKGGIKGETLDDEENSDEGDDEDYTVYECHGLAPVSCLQIYVAWLQHFEMVPNI